MKMQGSLRRFLTGIGKRLLIFRNRKSSAELTDEEKSFIAENAAFWSQYTDGNRRTPADGYVLVEHTYQPITLLCNASFTTMVSVARNLRPLFILDSPRDTAIRKMLESYNPDGAFFYVGVWRYLIPRLLTHLRAIRVFRTLKRPEDILKLNFDGIRYGDLVYDGVLNGGYATISRIDGKVYRAIRAFFWHRYVVRKIIQKYDVKTAVFSHIVGLKSGAYTRHLLQKGIEVFNRSGSHQIQLRKYRGMADVGIYCLKPEPRYFSFLMNQPGDSIIRLADNYLNDRFSQNIKDVAVEKAFNSGKRTFKSKEEFCDHYRLDPGKKTVFVMLHAFNDQPHSHFARQMIFRDYYDWFEKTLEIAKSVESVNWVFKEHPAAEFYPTRDVSLDAIFAGLAYPHIRFLNRQTDINARSLRYIADAIVTCVGTAGMEYACLGTPCVLAGESPYSGFGFTIEPRNAGEYREQLLHISEIPRLNDNQVRAAKCALFFQLGMMQGAPYLFCPYYDHWQVRKIDINELWRDAAALLRNGNKEEMKQQVSTLAEFINNPAYIQYVNLQKYDFMSEVIYGKPERETATK